LTRSQAVQAILGGVEYQTDLIQSSYQSILGRAADASGQAAFLQFLQAGGSREQLTALLVSSPEFNARDGSTPSGWVTGLYQVELGRAPDASALAYVEQLLSSGGSEYTLTTAIITSAEADTQFVDGVYQQFLNRQPSDAEAAGWVSAMQQGLQQAQVITQFASSDEFYQIQANNPQTAATPPGDGGGTDPNQPSGGGSDPGQSTGSDGSSSPGDPGVQLPTVTLAVPAFTTSTTPTVTVVTGPGQNGLASQVRIDVDLKNDGKFTDPGDFGQTVAFLTPGSNIIPLNALPRGTFHVRAEVSDELGNQALSTTASMVVDPYSGVVGSSALLDLAQGFATLPAQPSSDNLKALYAKFPDLQFDGQQRVAVHVRATLPQFLDGLRSSLLNIGMSITGVYPSQNMVNGGLPISQIAKLSSLPNFDTATEIPKPRVKLEEGDPVIGGPSFRASTGASGQGVKIGILSDSVNQFQGGIADSIAAGQLPPQGVQVLQDLLAGNGTDEGRAMLEIAHTVAPSAALAFYSGTNSEQDFANGIQALAAAGSQVEADDIAYPDSPMFNDGIIADAVDTVAAQNVFYASAAGNTGDQGWLGAWSAISATVAGTTGTFESFAGSPLQQFTLAAGGTFDISFQWDAAFLEGGAAPSGNFQVPNQINVLVTDSTGTTLLGAVGGNSATMTTNMAWQEVSFQNNTNAPITGALAFQLVAGPAPTALRWVNLIEGNQALAGFSAQGENGPTIFGQTDAPGAVSVSAAFWGTPTTPEPFTAVGGPIPFLFDAAGNRLPAVQLRPEPEVTGPDGVGVSFALNGLPAFFGTSAATPHVAGAAALLISQSGATAAQVRAHLDQTTTPINSPGVQDPVTGFGLIQLTPLTVTGGGGVPNPNAPQFPPDQYEPNNSSDTATNLGLLTGALSIPNLTIATTSGNLPDFDWFRFTAATGGVFTANVTESQGGNLEEYIYTLRGNTLVQLAKDQTLGVNAHSLTVEVGPLEPIFVEVKGRNSGRGVWDQGMYELDVSLT
jgi:hypothetical protein